MQTTTLPVHFLIVGAGVAGLSCAIALRRIGHKVTVLESRSGNDKNSGGLKLPPNATKILYHWGYQDEVRAISSKSHVASLGIFESGEFLGDHVWNEEVIRETRGEYQNTHYNDFHELLLKKAISVGANIRFNSRVVSVDPEAPSVTLASGKVITAHVVVGADGYNGLCRQIVVEDYERAADPLVIYTTTVPTAVMAQHDDLKAFHDVDYADMHTWFGNGAAVIGWPCGGGERGEGSFALQYFGPGESDNAWIDPIPKDSREQLLDMLSGSEPRLRKLAQVGSQPRKLPASGEPDFEDWVHDEGKLVLIGDAAHSLPILVQHAAMAIEDSAVLARLFLHLRNEEQIPSFLYAFQELRQPRIKRVRESESGNLMFMTLPPSEMTSFRDADIKHKQALGRNVLDPLIDENGSDSGEEGADTAGAWAMIKEMFGYDAEDEADNWWIEWGLLRERAKGIDMANDLRVSVAMVEAC